MADMNDRAVRAIVAYAEQCRRDKREGKATASYPGSKDMMSSDFSGADLSELNLPYSTWEQCDLTGANFTGALLAEAKFNRCEMKDSIFTGADLRWSVLNESDLENADFTDAIFMNTQAVKTFLLNAKLTHQQMQKIKKDTKFFAGYPPDHVKNAIFMAGLKRKYETQEALIAELGHDGILQIVYGQFWY